MRGGSGALLKDPQAERKEVHDGRNRHLAGCASVPFYSAFVPPGEIPVYFIQFFVPGMTGPVKWWICRKAGRKWMDNVQSSSYWSATTNANNTNNAWNINFNNGNDNNNNKTNSYYVRCVRAGV